jgi:hypothetical protein
MLRQRVCVVAPPHKVEQMLHHVLKRVLGPSRQAICSSPVLSKQDLHHQAVGTVCIQPVVLLCDRAPNGHIHQSGHFEVRAACNRHSESEPCLLPEPRMYCCQGSGNKHSAARRKASLTPALPKCPNTCTISRASASTLLSTRTTACTTCSYSSPCNHISSPGRTRSPTTQRRLSRAAAPSMPPTLCAQVIRERRARAPHQPLLRRSDVHGDAAAFGTDSGSANDDRGAAEDGAGHLAPKDPAGCEQITISPVSRDDASRCTSSAVWSLAVAS